MRDCFHDFELDERTERECVKCEDFDACRICTAMRLEQEKPVCFGNVGYVTDKCKCETCKLSGRCVTESLNRDTRHRTESQ